MTGPVTGVFGLTPPLGQGGVVAVFELLGGGQAGLQRGGGEGGQERLGDRGVDRDAADAQVPGAPAVDELAGAGAVVAGGGLVRALVVDRELAAAHAAAGQALQQRAAFPHRPGARLVRLRADVGADPGLVGLVGVPVQEPRVMIGDEHLPLALGQGAATDPGGAVGADVAVLAGLAEHVGARVSGMGEHVVHGMVGRLHPDDLGAVQVGGRLQREPQALVAQPQPDRADRPADGELGEDRGQDAGDGLVGM